MNFILLVGLLALAYFLFASGMEFFALLALVLGVMLLFAGARTKEESTVKISEPFGPQGPIIVENKMPDVPPRINLKLKQNWHEWMLFEYHLFNWGWAWHNLGHWLFNLFTGHKTKNPEKHGSGGGGH